MPRELWPGRRDAATLRPHEREPRFLGPSCAAPRPFRARISRPAAVAYFWPSAPAAPPPQSHRWGAKAAHVRPLPLETLQEKLGISEVGESELKLSRA